MNLSYILASAVLFFFSRKKSKAKHTSLEPRGLPPAEDADERDEIDRLLDDGRDVDDDEDERDYDDSLRDDGREPPSLYRDDDETIYDDVWNGRGVDSDIYARQVADRTYNQVIADGFHPLVADAKSLEAYDAKEGESPWYIQKKQSLIGADPTGIYDQQTQDRIDLIIAAAIIVRESEGDLPDKSSSHQLPSASPSTVANSQMFELKEPADWDLTPKERKTHAEARKLAIKEYQKARANGQSHQVGAAMWLGRYIKSGGKRKETIAMMQRESGMPDHMQNGVWDKTTYKWITGLTSDYRDWLSNKK